MVRDGDFLAATMPALDRVYNLARRLTRHGPDAEDLVQETYLRAWQGWCAGRRPRQVDAWMATICLNLARDAARARARRPREVGGGALDAWLSARASGEDVAALATDRVLAGSVEAAMAALPEPQRLAIVPMDLCGFTAKETAAITGSPRGTVLARVHRARTTPARLVADGEVDTDALRS